MRTSTHDEWRALRDAARQRTEALEARLDKGNAWLTDNWAHPKIRDHEDLWLELEHQWRSEYDAWQQAEQSLRQTELGLEGV